MIVARDSEELRRALRGQRLGAPKRRWRTSEVALVATMGALHRGHLELLDRASAENDLVVMSLFVNPLQFDDEQDLERYPRDEGRDRRLAAEHGVDVLYAPYLTSVYPAGFATRVSVFGFDELEGKSRPGHFPGVATVVLRLFDLVRPDRAYFGQKDAQQAVMVRRLVLDLELPVEVKVLETVREPDGLAYSSRNARLTAEGRKRAPALYRALALGAEAHHSGEADAVVEAEAKRVLGEAGLAVDYVAIRDYAPLGPKLLLAAVSVDGVRLIDNVTLAGIW